MMILSLQVSPNVTLLPSVFVFPLALIWPDEVILPPIPLTDLTDKLLPEMYTVPPWPPPSASRPPALGASPVCITQSPVTFTLGFSGPAPTPEELSLNTHLHLHLSPASVPAYCHLITPVPPKIGIICKLISKSPLLILTPDPLILVGHTWSPNVKRFM